MEFDFDSELGVSEREEEGSGPGQETRCYAITGTPLVLDRLEDLLRRIEWVGEEGMTPLVSAFVDGTGGAKIAVRVLASWAEEDEGAAEMGARLRQLPNEEMICGHYLIDMVAAGCVLPIT